MPRPGGTDAPGIPQEQALAVPGRSWVSPRADFISSQERTERDAARKVWPLDDAGGALLRGTATVTAVLCSCKTQGQNPQQGRCSPACCSAGQEAGRGQGCLPELGRWCLVYKTQIQGEERPDLQLQIHA